MSLAEILEELPRLTPEQRHQVVERVLELDTDGPWLDADLSESERRLIEERLAAHDREPGSAVPWEEVKAQLRERFAR